ncbi:hypothetical protein C5Y96_21365 [Blastopirellula marina]|uniref:Capsule biosynthesis protein n=1 Tax=Blastopirellula marina TaxID=124 RepID=A0A2S8F1J1_9BACT|nr:MULTISPECIES: hypothetical protein [Pirellulaceae]PQO26003.1 hypothetical protein C5Y96_21365 [Blastopirellula marina]
MPSTIVWGFILNSSRIIESLEKNGRIRVACWLGQKEITSLHMHPEKCLSAGSGICDRQVFESMLPHFPIFQRLYLRHARQKTQIGTPSLHDLQDRFRFYCDYLFDLLKRTECELILFSNIPHEGADFVLYELAKLLGIKTLMTFQLPFPNRHLILESANELGDYSQYPQLREPERISIPREFKKYHFYMKSWHSHEKRVLGIIPEIYLKPAHQQHIAQLIYQRYIKSPVTTFYNSSHNARFRKRVRKCSVVPNLSEPFVYFPLHLQPELTTDAIGGKYADQALAIEELHAMLPQGWKIYVKENPKQRAFARGPFFFDRIRRIPGAQIVPLETDTYELIKHSQFVSSITGTAGWEAITGGKPVLVFGKAWYRKLPGVFEFPTSMSAEQIAATEIDHSHLEESVADMLSRSCIGVTDPHYSLIVDNYDEDTNASLVASTLGDRIAMQFASPVVSC